MKEKEERAWHGFYSPGPEYVFWKVIFNNMGITYEPSGDYDGVHFEVYVTDKEWKHILWVIDEYESKKRGERA